MYIKNTSENKIFYATPLSAGFDICSTESHLLMPGERKVFKTGLFVDGPQHQYDLIGLPGTAVAELQIRPRSGLALKHGVTVLNSPGTVDADYPNEIGVILVNLGGTEYLVNKGDRIAQGVVALTLRAENVPVKPAERTGGFGSTGG